VPGGALPGGLVQLVPAPDVPAVLVRVATLVEAWCLASDRVG
jgi:hypothetical protein